MIRGIGELTNKQKAFVHTKALLAKKVSRILDTNSKLRKIMDN